MHAFINGIFHKTKTNKLYNLYGSRKDSEEPKKILRKKSGAGGINFTDEIILQSYNHQDCMVLAQKQKYRPIEQDRKFRNKTIHHKHLIFDKGGKKFNGEKIVSSVSGTWKTGQLCVKG